MKILKAKAVIKQENASNPAKNSPQVALRMRNACLETSVLAQNLTEILESYKNEQTKKLIINDWIQMQINQHPAGLALTNIKVGLQTNTDDHQSSSDDSSSTSSGEEQEESNNDNTDLTAGTSSLEESKGTPRHGFIKAESQVIDDECVEMLSPNLNLRFTDSSQDTTKLPSTLLRVSRSEVGPRSMQV